MNFEEDWVNAMFVEVYKELHLLAARLTKMECWISDQKLD